MIELISSQTSAYVWNVDGIIIKLGFNTKINTSKYIENIAKYKALIQSGGYKTDAQCLNIFFNYFGGLPFIRLGMEAFSCDFLEMCKYYVIEFIENWYKKSNKPFERIPSFTNVLNIMVKEKKSKCDSCFYMLNKYAPEHQNRLTLLMIDEFATFWGQKINSSLHCGEGLTEIRKKIGLGHLTKYCMDFAEVLTKSHIQTLATEFTKKREMISVHGMNKALFGNQLRCNSQPHRLDERFLNILFEVVEYETALQYEKFLAENHAEIDINKDCWILYKKHGNNLKFNNIDFTIIKNLSLRIEVKYYMACRLKESVSVGSNFVLSIAHALNVLIEINPNIHFAADISVVDVKSLHSRLNTGYITSYGNKLSNTTIGNIFVCCSNFVKYLMSDMRSDEIMSPRPYHNPFEKIHFVNLEAYKKNTLIIPEVVIEQIDSHINELKEHHRLFYQIFSNTGMRLKEALFLESDCIEPSRYENLAQIKYKPYKVIKSRRKAGIGDYHHVLIPSELAEKIKSYAQKTEEYRKSSGLPYIFLNAKYHFKVNMLCVNSFVIAVNRLIANYNLCGDDGILWHFTTRQCRKTIAVTLIENGATTEELAYWLGHLAKSTSMRYYAEVRKIKLAQLNTEFFKKHFELSLSSQQLDQFSEEERRLLYIDFRLEQRRVEFGFCLRKLADGGCTERGSIYNCVNCKNLCTGKKYLAHWQELLDSQQQFVSELISKYNQENVPNYVEFKEFKQANFLLKCYQDIVKKILKSEDE